MLEIPPKKTVKLRDATNGFWFGTWYPAKHPTKQEYHDTSWLKKASKPQFHLIFALSNNLRPLPCWFCSTFQALNLHPHEETRLLRILVMEGQVSSHTAYQEVLAGIRFIVIIPKCLGNKRMQLVFLKPVALLIFLRAWNRWSHFFLGGNS